MNRTPTPEEHQVPERPARHGGIKLSCLNEGGPNVKRVSDPEEEGTQIATLILLSVGKTKQALPRA